MRSIVPASGGNLGCHLNLLACQEETKRESSRKEHFDHRYVHLKALKMHVHEFKYDVFDDESMKHKTLAITDTFPN